MRCASPWLSGLDMVIVTRELRSAVVKRLRHSDRKQAVASQQFRQFATYAPGKEERDFERAGYDFQFSTQKKKLHKIDQNRFEYA